MPNGRNSGILFNDCENIHGYGTSHSIPHEAKPGDQVECRDCHRQFRITEDGHLELLEWEAYDQLVDGMTEAEAKNTLKREARLRYERSEEANARREAISEMHYAWSKVNFSTREGLGDFIGVMAKHTDKGFIP